MTDILDRLNARCWPHEKRDELCMDAWYVITDLRATVEALKSAAWDVCDVVQDALDTPEDADMKRIRKALEALGELLPAQRPTVRAAVAPKGKK